MAAVDSRSWLRLPNWCFHLFCDCDEEFQMRGIAWHVVSQTRRLTTHSTGAEIARFSFARLKACFGVSRPVNSGVRRGGILTLLHEKIMLAQ
jgi:hypothetical protein